MQPVTNFPDYFVDEQGQVYSSRRSTKLGDAGRSLHRLKPWKQNDHYWVGLYRDRQLFMFKVAWLVLETFIGPRPEGLEACHNDGDPKNNVLSNLRWDTRLANERDKVRHGTVATGIRHGRSKFTEDQVREIRRLWEEEKMSQSEIGRRFGTSQGRICMIVHRKNWKCLS